MAGGTWTSCAREDHTDVFYIQAMLIGLDHLQRRLNAGSHEWSGGRSTFLSCSPGEGDFRFERVTIGVVLAPLPSHQAAYGDDRRRPLPLSPGPGWIFPAGFDGWCRWDEPNDFLNEAQVRARHWLGDRTWAIAGSYDYALVQSNSGWHVASVTLRLADEWGDRRIVEEAAAEVAGGISR